MTHSMSYRSYIFLPVLALALYSLFRRTAMVTVKTYPLNDGNRIPAIAWGSGTALYGQNATEPAKLALAAGMVHIDAAQVYNNEDSLGPALTTVPRESIFVTTKLGRLKPGETVKQSLQSSLERLQLSYVDLFLIHSPTHHNANGKEGLQKLWKEFEDVKAEGLTKSIGVSNFLVDDLQTILDTAKVKPAVNQIEYHAYIQEATRATIELDQKHGIITAAYGSLTPITKRKGGPVDVVLEAIKKRLAKDSGKTVTEGQVILKWLDAKQIVAVTTTSKESRVKEYLDSLTLPELTKEEVQEIDKAGSGQHHRGFWSNVMD